MPLNDKALEQTRVVFTGYRKQIKTLAFKIAIF